MIEIEEPPDRAKITPPTPGGVMTTGTPRADHPHTDPGDGRTECDVCGKWVWLVIHSCKGVPVTAQARARAAARDAPRGDDMTPDPTPAPVPPRAGDLAESWTRYARELAKAHGVWDEAVTVGRTAAAADLRAWQRQARKGTVVEDVLDVAARIAEGTDS